MKSGIRAAALLLLGAMLIPAAVSCGETAAPQNTEDTKSADTAKTEPVDPAEVCSLDPALDFGGKTFNFLIREAVANTEFFVEAETGDIVDDALFTREQAVDERPNVGLNFMPMPGEWADRDTFNGAIRQSVMANDGAYDLCGVLSNQLSTLALEGLLLNLYELPHLDFSRAWWAKGLLDELAVYDKLYFASGDASLGLVNGMMCVFYNKSMGQDFDIPDMYELTNEGKWTIGKAIELTKDVWQDIDGSGGKSDADRLGFGVGDWNQLYGFIEGSGQGKVLLKHHFIHRNAQDGTVHDGHAANGPVVRGRIDHLVNFFLMGLNALQQGNGVRIGLGAVLLFVVEDHRLLRQKLSDFLVIDFGRVQQLQRSATRPSIRMTLSHRNFFGPLQVVLC